jgi:rhamnosyltransferase
MTDVERTTSVGLVIPTLNAGKRWIQCLDAIVGQTLKPTRSLIIDSASTDETVELARKAGFETINIDRAEFNHGGTRQWAAEYLTDCEILIFMTQDAVPANSASFEALAGPFVDPAVAVAYGRQLPHRGATAIEMHARALNYGPRSLRKDAVAATQIGAKVFFCSNSFAAYRRSVLLRLGGFRRDLILGEDMEFAARAVAAGYANQYCAEAAVFHSHDYTVLQTLERYFDIGVFDAENPWMRDQFGSHRSEGLRFVRSELRFLAARDPLQIPKALFQTAAKLMGYRLGRLHRRLPLTVKRQLSMHPGHWR